MKRYWAIVKKDLAQLRESKKELKDIYKIAFSHKKMIAYEQLVNQQMESMSYEELARRVEQFASYLHNTYPSSSGEYIAIDLPNSPSFLIAFWGSLMAGYSPYLVNSYYPFSLRNSLLKRLSISKIITLSEQYNTYFQCISIPMFLENEYETPKEEWWSNRFALSSSYTGMEAKIVVYDGASVAAEIENSDAILEKNSWFMQDFHGEIKIAAILPFFHIFGIMVSYLWFAFYGRTIVFFHDLSPLTIRSTIIRHGITHIFAPPILFGRLFDEIEKGVTKLGSKKKKQFHRAIDFIAKVGDFSPRLSLFLSRILLKEVRLQAFGESPRFMISGGASIKKEVLKTINAIGYPLFNGYGTTETSITGANLSLRFSKRIDGSIGPCFPSVSYSLEKDGTLLIAGSSLAKEILYLDGRRELIDTFHTNDLVTKKDQTYFIEGRLSDLFISENGENISPDFIEAELCLPLASSFCVLELEGRLTLVIEYRKNTPSFLIEKEVNSLKEQLAHICYGKNVTRLYITNDSLANSNAIKVSRVQLKKAILEEKVHLFPITALKSEQAEEPSLISLIEQLFKNSLNKDVTVSPNSDYFLDLGGDSLGYFSLVMSIEETFGVRFDLEKESNLRSPNAFYQRIKENL